MIRAHFFQARSRAGLRNPPLGSTVPNVGVEDAPQAILTSDFLATFPQTATTVFSFPDPQSIPQDIFLPQLAEHIREFKNTIAASLEEGDIQVVIGGDHSVTLPSALAAIERHGETENFGYVQFDSHADLNLASQSATHNFHGMYVRPLVDEFDVPEINALARQKIPARNMMYIGNLDLDPGEKEFMETHHIAHLSHKAVQENPSRSLDVFRNFIADFAHVHVSFDIDCLDGSEAPATGIPAKSGLFMRDVLPFLALVGDHPSFSFDLTEVNPKKQGAQKTILCAQKALSTVLEKKCGVLSPTLEEVSAAV